MAVATKKQVTAKFSGAGLGERAMILNVTKGWRKEVMTNASGEIVYNPYQDNKTTAEGDVIYVYLNGKNKGSGSGTIASGGVDITVTTVAETVTRQVTL